MGRRPYVAEEQQWAEGVVHKWSCEQLKRNLDVLICRWTYNQRESRWSHVQWADGVGSLIEADVTDREPKDRADVCRIRSWQP